MSKPNINLETLTIDEMLDLKDALEARLTEVAKTETALMSERLKRLQAYLPDEKPALRRSKKPAKSESTHRAPQKASSATASKPPKPSPTKPASTTTPKAAGKKTKPSRKPKIAAKYRDPQTGKTWSGRGRVPIWMRDYEDAGRKRAEFSI